MQEQREPLSERELEILRLVATGAANKEIARQLVISPNTVKVHLRNIFTKIGVASRTEATLYAIEIGLIRPGVEQVQPVEEADAGPAAPAGNSASGPAITDETASAGPVQARIRPWQVGLFLVLAILAGFSVPLAARYFNPPAPTPTAASQAQPAAPAPARWAQKAPLPEPRKGMGIIEYENTFYLIGGETSQGVDGALLSYSPQDDDWKTLAEKPTPVTGAQAALLGEKIYVPGGQLPDGQTTGVMEVYDPRSGRWQDKAALPIPLSGYALSTLEGRLYVFGGKTGEQYSTAVYSYDPEEDRWEERSPLSSARAYAATAVYNGRILVIGGFDGEKALALNEVYYPSRETSGENPWEELAPLPQGRYGMGATQIAAFIFLAGGSQDSSLNTAQPAALLYTPLTDAWNELEAPVQPLGIFPALVPSGNFLFVFGGETSAGLSNTSQSYQAIYTITVPAVSGGE